MCGIVGYLGNKSAKDVVITGLKGELKTLIEDKDCGVFFDYDTSDQFYQMILKLIFQFLI